MQLPRPAAPKDLWREWASTTRQQLLRGHPDFSPDAAALVTHLRDFLKAHAARRVLAYHALPGEPDVAALQTDIELLTTRTHFRPHKHLTLHPYASATEPSKAGYLQPPATAPQVSLDSVDAVLLPGLAFDRQGVRLGYGGGFYDRLLPGYAGLMVGVVWSPLLVPELPCEAHDLQVGWIASESGVVRADKS